MPDPLLLVASVLAAATVLVAVEYYRQLRKARSAYERAKGAVDDIVLSFNRQFGNEASKLETMGYKVEAASSRGESSLKKSEELEGLLRALEGKVASDLEDRKNMSVRLADLEKKASGIIMSQEAITSKLAGIEQQTSRFEASAEAHLEGVIPLKREKAMAQLTDTEVAVLELLVSEGAKTAPEIKERVKLSREHTARLMKKLYEEGYLERDTGKIPFRYSVKKEMEKLLRKTESEAA